MQVTLDTDLVVFAVVGHGDFRLLGGRLDVDDEGATRNKSLDGVDQLELYLSTKALYPPTCIDDELFPATVFRIPLQVLADHLKVPVGVRRWIG